MSALGREQILAFAQAGRLVTDFREENAQGCSYDLRVGTIFQGTKIIKASSPPEERFAEMLPGDILSMFSLEELALPADIFATAFAINRLSSRGLLVLNPGHVDPGFRGPLTITAINLNKTPQTISIGDDILTVVFEQLDRETMPYEGSQDRAAREAAYSRHVQTVASKNVGVLVAANADSPLVSEAELDDKLAGIRGNDQQAWHNLIQNVTLGVGLFGGIIAVASFVIACVGVVAAFGGCRTEPQPANAPWDRVEAGTMSWQSSPPRIETDSMSPDEEKAP